MSRKIGPDAEQSRNVRSLAPIVQRRRIPLSAPGSSHPGRTQLPAIVENAMHLNIRPAVSQPPTTRTSPVPFFPPFYRPNPNDRPNLKGLRQLLLELDGKEDKLKKDFSMFSDFIKELADSKILAEPKFSRLCDSDSLQSIAEMLTYYKSLLSLLNGLNESSLSSVRQIILFDYNELNNMFLETFKIIGYLLTKVEFFNDFEKQELFAAKENLEKIQIIFQDTYIKLKDIDQSSLIQKIESLFKRIITQLSTTDSLPDTGNTKSDPIISYYLNYSPAQAEKEAKTRMKKKERLPGGVLKIVPAVFDVEDLPGPSRSKRSSAISKDSESQDKKDEIARIADKVECNPAQPLPYNYADDPLSSKADRELQKILSNKASLSDNERLADAMNELRLANARHNNI
ncbi:MAG: hypothetical protein WCT85_06385 [Parachlamydiales bacterium]